MGAHAVPARHRRSRGRSPDRTEGRHTLRWALPVALGVFYGFYAQFIERSGEGPVTWGQALLGLVSGVVFGALCYGLGRVQRALPRELRAAAYGSVTGIGVGFLHSLTGESVLTAVVVALAVGAGVFCAAFYIFYTRE